MVQTQQINLTINKLTKQQYDSIQSPVATDLYLVTDDDYYTSSQVDDLTNLNSNLDNIIAGDPVEDVTEEDIETELNSIIQGD